MRAVQLRGDPRCDQGAARVRRRRHYQYLPAGAGLVAAPFHLSLRLACAARAAWHRTDSLRGVSAGARASLSRGRQRVLVRGERGPALRPSGERAVGCLPRARFSVLGRAGANLRSLAARQSMDVPHHPRAGPTAAAAPRASGQGCRWVLPAAGRAHAGAHGSQPQRLERHLLSRHGLSRGRARPECFDRPRGVRPRRSDRSPHHLLSARHRSAGPASGQCGSRRRRRADRGVGGIRLRTGLPGTAQGRGHRRGPGATRPRGLGATPVASSSSR